MSVDQELTSMQKEFVVQMLIDPSQTRAARRAGYQHPNRTANRLMKMPHVLAAIEQAKEERMVRMKLKQETVILELHTLAFSDIGDVCKWDNDKVTLKPSWEMSPRARRAIKTVKHGKHGVEVYLHDKSSALNRLADHMNIGAKRIEHKHDHSFQKEIVFTDRRSRALPEDLPEDQQRVFVDEPKELPGQ